MIFITSHPYVGQRHRRVFDFFKRRDDLVFVLPQKWEMKDGKVVIRPETAADLKVVPLKTRFFHSHYPIIKGQLKAWLPGLGFVLKKISSPGDVLYSVSEPNLLVTYLNAKIAKKFKMKFACFTWQNIDYNKRLSGIKLRITEWLLRKNLALSDGVICGNSRAYEFLKPYLSQKIKVLVSPVSGMDIEQFKPSLDSNIKSNLELGGRKILLFVGAMDLRKGIFKLIDAFVIARKTDPSLYLIMIGSGPLDQEIRNYATEKGLDNDCRIMPWVDNAELPDYFSGSDIFIYPSQRRGGWEEQFGYSMAEASSSGLPVISTNTGSIADLVIDNKTGILVEPEDTKAMADAIIRLSKDEELRHSMGKKGREHIVNNFSHNVIGSKLENFLRNL